MIKGDDNKKSAESEKAAEKAAAKDALPRLMAQRDKLEREGGAQSRLERNHWARVGAGVAVTIVLALYTLTAGTDERGETPILLWVITGACGIATAAMAVIWDKAKSARRRHQEELSAKMKQIGRRIDSADRTMRR